MFLGTSQDPAKGAGISVPTTLSPLSRLSKLGQSVWIDYLSGDLIEGGELSRQDLAQVHSVAGFFISRVDTEADRQLTQIGRRDELGGKLGLANAKLAYQTFVSAFSGPRWEGLAVKGAKKQRCLWASTSTKHPAYPDVMYVEGLIGPETVNTMTGETVRAFQDHGQAAETLGGRVGDAHRVLDEFTHVGVSYDKMVATLEREGVSKFVASFEELLHGIGTKRDALSASKIPREEAQH